MLDEFLLSVLTLILISFLIYNLIPILISTLISSLISTLISTLIYIFLSILTFIKISSQFTHSFTFISITDSSILSPTQRPLSFYLLTLLISLHFRSLFSILLLLLLPLPLLLSCCSLGVTWQLLKSDVAATITGVCNRILHDRSATTEILKKRRQGMIFYII